MIYTALPSFDPQTVSDVLDNTFVFDNIPAGDSITSATVTASPGDLQISEVTITGSAVTCWVTGGTPNVYTLTATVITTSGREMARSATMTIRAVV